MTESDGGQRPPVIGISAYSERASWSGWETEATVLPARYSQRVSQAGAIPVLLPPVPGIARAVDRLDGLLLAGGGDVDPACYRAERSPHSGPASAERDEAELALFARALSLGLPVLGICRGLQLINVAMGGTLHQHLPDLVGNDDHEPFQGRHGAHEVQVAAGTMLAGILGRAGTDGTAGLAVTVPTHHHQAIDAPGAGLTATAWAADGVVEAVELDPAEHPFVLAVQWHPEAGDDLSLFRALAAARRMPAPAL